MIRNYSVLYLFSLIIAFLIPNNILFANTTADFEESNKNIFSLMDSGNYDGAKAAIDKFISDYSKDYNLPIALYWISRRYEWSSKFDEAKRFYNFIIENCPNSTYANAAPLGIVRCEAMSLVITGEFELAKKTIDKMSVDFSGHADLPESLYMIGERFEWQWQFENEKSVFQLIIRNCSGSPFASKAQIGIARADTLSFIASQDYINFEKALDKLFANFSDNPDLPQTALIIGEWFYKDGISKRRNGLTNEAKDRYERAIKVWDRVIRELPDSNLTPEACYWVGESLTELGQYKEAIELYKKACDGFPQFAVSPGINYIYRWRSMFMIGQNLQKLKQSSDINSAEADPIIIETYERLVREYSNCPLAKDAWRELGYLYFQNNYWQDTVKNLEAYLKLVPQVRCPPEVFYCLARAYDQLGEFDSAKKNYNLFIGSAAPDDPQRKEARNRVVEIMKDN